jgi:hypothetical protein
LTACGVALALHGFDVTGLDISKVATGYQQAA